MLEASDKEPDIVVIVVSLKGGTESVTKYISGQTVEEVCSKLFGDGTVAVKKPRAKRRTQAEIEAAKAQPPATENPEPSMKKDKKEKAWA